MEKQQIKIVIIGAGYAGLLASVRLAMNTRKQAVSITLINSSESFVERPRLHQYASNQVLKQRPISDVLRGTGIQFLKAEVQSIDVAQQVVVARAVVGLQHLKYDYLLYTAGSTIELDSVPGVREYAYALTPAGLRSARALKTLLPEVDKIGGQLVVVGGGPTGIEAAAEFAESYPGLHVKLVTQGELAQSFGGKIQAHIRLTLARLGVSVNDQQQVERLEPNRLVTVSGTDIIFDLCLWAGGFVASPLAREAGLAVNDRGQVLVDPYMRSISDSHVYAAGDSAQLVSSSGIQVRMAAYTAAITGAHAADCLANAIKGQQQTPLNFAYLGQGIALGRHDTVGFNNYPDDKPKNPVFTGLAGVLGRELFVNLLADLPAIERRLPGLHFWPPSKKTAPIPELSQEARFISR